METFPDTEIERGYPDTANIENMVLALEEWADNPTGNDPYLRVMGPALAKLVQNFEPVRSAAELMLLIRQEPESVQSYAEGSRPKGPKRILTTQYAANLMRCSLTNVLLRDSGSYIFPRDFTNPERYLEVVFDKYATYNTDIASANWVDSFENNLGHRAIQTNEPKRYKGVMLTKYRYPDIFPNVIRNVDIGSSRHEGWTQLAMNAKLPFDEFTALKIDPNGQALVPDTTLSWELNQYINQPLDIEYSIGVDHIDPRNEDAADWIWSCRRPKEYTDVDIVNRDYFLANAALANLGFARANFSNFNDLDKIRRRIKDMSIRGEYRPPNLLTMFTAAYENSDDEIAEMFNNASDLIDPHDPNSLLILQEPVSLNPDAPNGLEFSDDFRIPGIYKTIAYWPNRPDRGFQVVAAYSDGRCGSGIVNTDRAEY